MLLLLIDFIVLVLLLLVLVLHFLLLLLFYKLLLILLIHWLRLILMLISALPEINKLTFRFVFTYFFDTYIIIVIINTVITIITVGRLDVARDAFVFRYILLLLLLLLFSLLLLGLSGCLHFDIVIVRYINGL